MVRRLNRLSVTTAAKIIIQQERMMTARLMILNGPNLNLLGIRKLQGIR
jgi:hypothetical protein